MDQPGRGRSGRGRKGPPRPSCDSSIKLWSCLNLHANDSCTWLRQWLLQRHLAPTSLPLGQQDKGLGTRALAVGTGDSLRGLLVYGTISCSDDEEPHKPLVESSNLSLATRPDRKYHHPVLAGGAADQGTEKPLARLVSCSSFGTKSPTSFEAKGFVTDVTKGLIWRPVADGCREPNAVPP
jgi:hypothetical protein